MSGLILTAGFCVIIARFASSSSLTNTDPKLSTGSEGSNDSFCHGKIDGNYVNPNNLHTFYSCLNGLTFIQNCPQGLIFKRSCKRCEWPKTTTTTTNPGGSSGGFCQGKTDGNYVNPSNLNTFYSCSSGLTYIMNCPAGLIFKSSCNCCDWPNTQTLTNASKSGGFTGGFCQGKTDGNYVNPSNMNTFYSCSNGVTYIMNCPAGLIFNLSCNCCDWPKTTTPTTTTPSGGFTGGFCEGKIDGIYANPSNVHTFYMCFHGITCVRSCPSNLIFEQSCKCCNWPTTNPGGSTGGFCQGKTDGNYVNPSNLHTFYNCSNGLTYIMYCPAGLIFKLSCNCCDWPKTTTPTTTTPSSGCIGGFCKGKVDGIYANPSNVHTFYMCSHGITYVKNCPSNLIFEQSCKCCNWPTTNPGGPTGGFCQGKTDGNYVNPSNKNTFYSCSNGLTYIMYCPSELIFKLSCNCCDWPKTTTPTTTTPSSGFTGGFCKGKVDGIYSNPSNVHTFYMCSHGITYVKNCPSNLIFEQSCKCCNWPTTNPGGSTGGFCQGKTDGNYVNPSNKNTFYSCSNGLTYIMYCPSGLIFKLGCNCCDWPKTTTPTTTTPSSGFTGGFCKGKVDGIYANPSNVHTFYMCSHGITYVKNCPSNLIFEQSCKCCNWPTTNPGGSTGGFCQEKTDGNYVNPSSLHTFYSCSNGLTYIMKCPAGLIFNLSCNCCDWPKTTTPTTTTTSARPTQGFCGEKSDGLYANPSNLNTYYSCSNGITYIMKCSTGLIFIDSCKCCNWG